MKLSKNFSLQEMTKSQTALRRGIDNTPSPPHVTHLELLCEKVLQPLRDHFDRPVTITSGYRSPELCVAIGSTIKSQHAKGQAADFEIPGVSNMEFLKAAVDAKRKHQGLDEISSVDFLSLCSSSDFTASNLYLKNQTFQSHRLKPEEF